MDKQYDLPRVSNITVTKEPPYLPKGHANICVAYSDMTGNAVNIDSSSNAALLKAICELVNNKIEDIEKSLS